MATVDDSSRVDGQLDGVNPQLITVGKHCVVGSRAALLTHCPIRGARPVVLEDYVWIGYGALVLPGVTVGSCSVIGAGAVVTKDVPPFSVVAGNPARVMRSLTIDEGWRLRYRLEYKLPMGKHDADDR